MSAQGVDERMINVHYYHYLNEITSMCLFVLTIVFQDNVLGGCKFLKVLNMTPNRERLIVSAVCYL